MCVNIILTAPNYKSIWKKIILNYKSLYNTNKTFNTIFYYTFNYLLVSFI
jgi:hypothetical protein